MAACLHQTSQSKHQTFLCGKTYAYGMRERLQAFICKTTRVAAGDIDAMLNNERDASSRRTDLLRVCDTAMAVEQSATTSPSASPAELEFDHVWIVVTR